MKVGKQHQKNKKPVMPASMFLSEKLSINYSAVAANTEGVQRHLITFIQCLLIIKYITNINGQHRGIIGRYIVGTTSWNPHNSCGREGWQHRSASKSNLKICSINYFCHYAVSLCTLEYVHLKHNSSLAIVGLACYTLFLSRQFFTFQCCDSLTDNYSAMQHCTQINCISFFETELVAFNPVQQQCT